MHARITFSLGKKYGLYRHYDLLCFSHGNGVVVVKLMGFTLMIKL